MNLIYSIIHSKNTGVELDPEIKGSIGAKLPIPRQIDSEYDPELGQFDPIICQVGQVCRKLTKFRGVTFVWTWPQWTLWPDAGPGVFRV